MQLFKNFTMKIVKMNFNLWKFASNIILIEILTSSFCWVWIYITYQIKKRVYIIKNVCVWGGGGSCIDKYINAAT